MAEIHSRLGSASLHEQISAAFAPDCWLEDCHSYHGRGKIASMQTWEDSVAFFCLSAALAQQKEEPAAMSFLNHHDCTQGHLPSWFSLASKTYPPFTGWQATLLPLLVAISRRQPEALLVVVPLRQGGGQHPVDVAGVVRLGGSLSVEGSSSVQRGDGLQRGRKRKGSPKEGPETGREREREIYIYMYIASANKNESE